jgi:negative regulator of sigma E activity
MACKKYQRKLSRLLDGELSPRDVSELTSHLADCDKCRTALEGYKSLSNELSRDPELPEGFTQTVMEAVRAASAQKAPKTATTRIYARRRFPVFRVASAAAVAAVALLITVSLNGNRKSAAPMYDSSAEIGAYADTSAPNAGNGYDADSAPAPSPAPAPAAAAPAGIAPMPTTTPYATVEPELAPQAPVPPAGSFNPTDGGALEQPAPKDGIIAGGEAPDAPRENEPAYVTAPATREVFYITGELPDILKDAEMTSLDGGVFLIEITPDTAKMLFELGFSPSENAQELLDIPEFAVIYSK